MGRWTWREYLLSKFFGEGEEGSSSGSEPFMPHVLDDMTNFDPRSQSSLVSVLLVVTFVLLVTLIFVIPAKLWKYLEPKLTVSIHVSAGMLPHGRFYNQGEKGDNKPYYLLLRWLSQNVNNVNHIDLGWIQTVSQNGQEDENEFKFKPNFGTLIFGYRGRKIKMVRKRHPELVVDHMPYESITLSAWIADGKLLDQIMQEAMALDKLNDMIPKTVFHAIRYGEWTMTGSPRNRRSLDSVILTQDIGNRLIADVNEFLTSEAWYVQRGIPYRRGYLLYGPPGCGKSSVVKAIAGEIGFDVCVLSLSSMDLTDDDMNHLMNTTPAKSIILLEDIESAFKSRGTAGNEDEPNMLDSVAFAGAGSSHVTFRGLLNALDGVASTEGRIVFMTTNFIERLDKALIRPGRVDLKVHIDLPDESQIQRMFARFYPDCKDGLDKQFAVLVKSLSPTVSMAMIQGLLMLRKDDPEGSIENAKKHFNEQHFNLRHAHKTTH